MDKSKPFVITVNREAGSGGRTIGRKLAENLNVRFYDKIVLENLVERFKLTPAEIERLKDGKPADWDEFYDTILSEPDFGYKDSPGKITTAKVYKTEVALIRHLAESESCVIAGRSAFHALKDHPNKVSVFIRASLPGRVSRIVSKQGLSEEDAKDELARIDEGREKYTTKFTGSRRYDSRNYDLVINTDNLDEDQAVKCILDYLG